MDIIRWLRSSLRPSAWAYRFCPDCPEVRLSEWFISEDPMGRWGMYCYRCGKVSPWLEHQRLDTQSEEK